MRILLVSSSGGHFEELNRLSFLKEKNDTIWVTEKTKYSYKADEYLIQTGSRDLFFIAKMALNYFRTQYILNKYKPDLIISTGSMVSIPFFIIAKKRGVKTIFIESFAKVSDLTRTGRFLYGKTDLFIVQWKKLAEKYPKSIYGGSIF